jgi:hypothetical protein|tara:strand:- start:96 stop:347 length:252 start_codon:yes stop_codon:yes gene_type:complete
MDLVTKINEFSSTNPEAVPMIYDILRTLTMQFIVQMLFSMNNPSVPFINSVFIQTTLFLCLGIMVFWLIVYKLTSQITTPLIK